MFTGFENYFKLTALAVFSGAVESSPRGYKMSQEALFNSRRLCHPSTYLVSPFRSPLGTLSWNHCRGSAAGWPGRDSPTVAVPELKHKIILPAPVTVTAGQSVAQVPTQRAPCARQSSWNLWSRCSPLASLRLKTSPCLWLPRTAPCRGHTARVSGSKPLENVSQNT